MDISDAQYLLTETRSNMIVFNAHSQEPLSNWLVSKLKDFVFVGFILTFCMVVVLKLGEFAWNGSFL